MAPTVLVFLLDVSRMSKYRSISSAEHDPGVVVNLGHFSVTSLQAPFNPDDEHQAQPSELTQDAQSE